MHRIATTLATLAASAIIPFVGCAEDAAPVAREEPGSALEADKADSVDYDNWTYFIVTRHDTRRCISPVCGGVFVKRLNQPEVKCADGKWAKECYVGSIDFAALGFSEEESIEAASRVTSGQAVIRGQITTGYYPGDFKDIPAFVATEVWTALTEKKPANTFFRAHDAGIMCITSPCPSLDATKLNKNASPYARYAGLDMSGIGASDEQIAAAWDALRSDMALVAGKTVKVTGPGGTANSLKANQVYLPMKAAEATAEGKVCGGRAGACPEGYYCQFHDELCGKADGGGTCQVPPTVCTEQYEPVCGCDGVTYSNDCYRKAAGAGFGTPGECKTDAACQIAGCSGELCIPAGSDGGISICLWREEYACYQQLGVCETQADGTCGWTATEELESCLHPATQH